jgi:flavin reductase (DIM6/NTAB) family NADH-FMN oxidoreductase RutF
MSIDATAFKKGMRHLAASVTMITTRQRELRGGLTATAVCSVSAEPPQIEVGVRKTA